MQRAPLRKSRPKESLILSSNVSSLRRRRGAHLGRGHRPQMFMGGKIRVWGSGLCTNCLAQSSVHVCNISNSLFRRRTLTNASTESIRAIIHNDMYVVRLFVTHPVQKNLFMSSYAMNFLPKHSVGHTWRGGMR